MSGLKFGLTLPIRGACATIENVTTAATETEAAGFDTVYINDHIVSEWQKHLYDFQGIPPPEVPENLADPFVFESISTLGYLTAITKKVEIAVSVIFLPIRNPIILAKQLATIDYFSKGRLVVGFGVGNIQDRSEAENVNIRYPYEERGKVVDEYIRAIKLIWTEPEPSFDGKYVKFKNLLIYPKPHRHPHPPIIIGGRSPAAESRAASLGDGYHPPFSGVKDIPGEISRITEMRRKVGKDMQDFRFVGMAFSCINESREKAIRVLKYQLIERGGGLYGGEHEKEQEDMLKRKREREEDIEKSLVGTPSDVIKKIEEIRSIPGVTHLQIHFVHPTFESYMKQLRLFAKDVLPSFT